MNDLKLVDTKNIIVSRTDKIGDLVLSIPSFCALRDMYPNAKIHVLARSYNCPILEELCSIDNVICVDQYSDEELLNKVKEINAEVFVALFANSKIFTLARKSKIKYRVGPYSKIMSFISFNKGVRQKRSLSIQNEAQYNLDLVKSLNHELFNKVTIRKEPITYSYQNDDVVLKFLKEENLSNKDFIIIHPFTGGSAKNITIKDYITVINKLFKKDPNLNIVITCAEGDKEDAQVISNNVDKKVHLFINKGSLLNLVAMIDKCSTFVGGSTGPSHIAGNLDKPCVCLYPVKPSLSKTRWGLFLNENVTYLSPDQNNPDENYKSKLFDIINDEFLESFAESILNRLKYSFKKD